MTQGFDIDAMVAELEPVKPLRMVHGMAAVGLLMAVAVSVIILTFGLRADLLSAQFHPMFLLRAGLLLLLGGGCGWAVLNMASPAVGHQGQSWKMAIAAAALMPLAALLVMVTRGADVAMANAFFGMQCMAFSALAGLATAVPMVMYLRRGAPTSPERAGFLTGVTAGGLGAFAYSLHCPFNDVVYIGLWYTLAVGGCAVIGRLVVPKLIRW
jgi:hypothetical protein